MPLTNREQQPHYGIAKFLQYNYLRITNMLQKCYIVKNRTYSVLRKQK